MTKIRKNEKKNKVKIDIYIICTNMFDKNLKTIIFAVDVII